METTKKIDACDVDSVSFLFEESNFSYIKQQGKSNFEKLTFSLENLDSISKLEKILNRLDKDKFFEQKYKFIDISILSEEFTLIPLKYFDEENAEIFLNHNVPYSKNKGLRFNLIPQFNLAVVFYYHEELENILIESSDKVRITHTAFKFLYKIENKDGFYINVYNKNIEIAVIQNNKLILYNLYPYQEMLDIKYFLQITAKNLNISLSNCTLFYFGNVNLKDFDIISQDFNKIEAGNKNEFERTNFTTLDLI